MIPEWLAAVEGALHARTTGVVLTFNTADRVRLDEPGETVLSLKFALARHFGTRGYRAGCFSLGEGFRELRPPTSPATSEGPSPFGDVPDGVGGVLTLSALGDVLRRPERPVLVVLDYADHLVPAPTAGHGAESGPDRQRCLEIVHGWGLDDNIRATRNLVILISYENEVHPLLTSGGSFRSVRMPLPSREERRGFLDFVLDRWLGEEAQGILEVGLEREELSVTANGLRLLDLEGLVREAASTGTPLSRDRVREAKKHTIATIGRELLEVVEPRTGFDGVAGVRHARDYFELIKKPWQRGASHVPQAILLAGVPGCGKSHLVHAVAHELQVPLLVMRNVREQWVGASERNLETVLWVVESLSPCVLWTDEVDQAMGQRGTGASGDSGTSERMLARLFEFFGSMQHRGRLLWLATTNRPDLLDTALLDRFQVTIPFIHPNGAERAELLPLLAEQIGCRLDPDIDTMTLASMAELDGITVRSLQEILVMARLQSRDGADSDPPISEDALLDVIRDFKPTYDAGEHEFIALTSLQMSPFRSLLPWSHDPAGIEDRGWPEYVETVVAPETGELRTDALAERLRELKSERRLGRALR